ncbi:MAG: bifunctional uridylyltransferase/uridylyl-removing protein, partial [Sphingomicrobium sp.]
RYHLLLSSTAFKRDLADPKTIEDFVGQVQSPERLRLLLILTVVDIRAVGPNVWNDWKRTLLRGLFEAAEERLRLGHKQHGRSELVEERRAALAAELGWKPSIAKAYARRLPDSYWLAETMAWQIANARQIAGAEARIGEARPNVEIADDPDSSATRVSIFTPDRDGLFHRICAGLAGAGANILDARIHTTRDKMALDNLLVLNGQGRPYSDRRLRARLERAVKASLESERPPALPQWPSDADSTKAFSVAASVAISDKASSRTTVAEVNARDRPALLARLTAAIHALGHRIHSAHIATYGERAVDVFYLTRKDGRKLSATDSAALRASLLDAASAPDS